MIGIPPQRGGLDVWSLQEEVLISYWSGSMEQSSHMSNISFAFPKHGSRYEIYRLGVEGDEGKPKIQSQPAILGGPCARGKLGPCA